MMINEDVDRNQIVENIIGSNYRFEFNPVSEDLSIESLIMTSIKARILCEGMCVFILGDYGVHMKSTATIGDFVSNISKLSEEHPALKRIVNDLKVLQTECNSLAHYQKNKFVDYKDVQIIMASLNKIEEWFIDNYEEKIEYNIEDIEKIDDDKSEDHLIIGSPYDLKKDFVRLLSEAQNGSVKAIYEIANMYFYGIITDENHPGRNLDKAALWFKKLSEVNENDRDYDDYYKAYGMRYLGHMYYSGMIPYEKQSYEKCFMLHTEAEKLSITAVPHLAYMYLMGSGCKADIKMAENLYETVVKGGDPSHIKYLANLYKISGNYKRAAELYEIICNKLPEAAFELGMLYKNGLISDNGPDYFKAAIYFDKTIKAGYSEAKAYLEKGKMYFNPTGGFVLDFEEAERCFLKSANLRNYEACYMLGYMYQYGHVKSATVDLAILYHKRAAVHGVPSSALATAMLLQQKGDYENAFEFARMAYNMGNPEGSFVYGNMLFLGIGCKPNLFEAKKAYDYAIENGYKQASIMVNKLIECEPDII